MSSSEKVVDNKKCDNEIPLQKERNFVKYSLGFLSIDSRIRKKILNLVSPGSPFDSFILFVIFLNSISIACIDYRCIDGNYNPRTDVSTINLIVEKLDIIFTAFFVAEAILKIFAYGFICGENTYLQDHWNKFDFIVVSLRWEL